MQAYGKQGFATLIHSSANSSFPTDWGQPSARVAKQAQSGADDADGGLPQSAAYDSTQFRPASLAR